MRVIKTNVFRWVREHTKLVAGVSAGVVVGAAGAAVVSASIPAANGTIYACYTTNNTSFLARMRVIDNSTQTCSANETAINWNQQGPAGPQGPQGPAGNSASVAYGATVYNENTDSYDLVNSYNVTNAVPRTDARSDVGICVTVNFTPKNVLVDRATNNGAAPSADTKDANGNWLMRNVSDGADPCADLPGTNVWVLPGTYFLVH